MRYKLIAWGLGLSMVSCAYAANEDMQVQDGMYMLRMTGMVKAAVDKCNLKDSQQSDYYNVISNTILSVYYYTKIKSDIIDSIHKHAYSYYYEHNRTICTQLPFLINDLEGWNTHFLYDNIKSLYQNSTNFNMLNAARKEARKSENEDSIESLNTGLIYRKKWVPADIRNYEAGYNSQTHKAWLAYPVPKIRCMEQSAMMNQAVKCEGGYMKIMVENEAGNKISE